MQDAQPHLFVALYAGNTIGEARVIAASDDAALVETAVNSLYSARQLGTEAIRQIVSQNKSHALNSLGQQKGNS